MQESPNMLKLVQLEFTLQELPPPLPGPAGKQAVSIRPEMPPCLECGWWMEHNFFSTPTLAVILVNIASIELRVPNQLLSSGSGNWAGREAEVRHIRSVQLLSKGACSIRSITADAKYWY